jgi:Cys-rich protein (TIGR01571 family)
LRRRLLLAPCARLHLVPMGPTSKLPVIVVVFRVLNEQIIKMQLRSKIRQRYNIDGNCFTDCCMSFWCNPCDMAQQSRSYFWRRIVFG